MSDPVTVAEASLLARDQEQAPWQQALVLVVSGGLTRAELATRVSERIGYTPRFRRIVTGWPTPVWSDDIDMFLTGHIREVTLAAGQRLEDWLQEKLVVALTRAHPLWEITLVNGVAPGRQAVVVRIHPALVDGYDHVHLFQELLDDQPDDIGAGPTDDWEPAPAAPPDVSALLAGLGDPMAAVQRVTAGVVGLLEGGLRTVTTASRRQYVGGTEIELSLVDAIRHSFDCTTHDVLLSLATAGVRAHLAENGAALDDPVALIPLAITEPAVLETAIGCRLAPSFDQLPVTETDAGARLTAVATLGRARRDTGLSVPARDLVDLAGFAPATLHAVAAGTVGAGRAHTVTVSNVPGPVDARYLGRARVRQVYAVTGLTDAEVINVSITSYRGRASFAVCAAAGVESWPAAIATELAALRAEVR